jgi:hypothetical protein
MKIIKQTPKYIGVQGIYAIVNIDKPAKFCPLGTPYVGQAMSKPMAKKHKMGIGTRLRDHRYKLRKNIHGNPKLQNAWNSYGEDSFVYVLVERVDDINLLTEREQHWLDKWHACKNGYNVREIAETTRGFHIKSILDKKAVIEWIKKYKEEHGKFPCNNKGKIKYANEKLTWSAVSMSMQMGWRGFDVGGSLSKFIAKEFNIVNGSNKKQLTEDVICEWFEKFYIDHGYYPTTKTSGVIEYADAAYGKIKWSAVGELLKNGQRGLNSGGSLRKLIEKRAINKIKLKHWYNKKDKNELYI